MNVPKDIVIDQSQKKDVHTGLLLPDLATRPRKAPEHRKEGSASSSRGALPKRAGIP